MTTGEKIAKLRKEKNLSQELFGDLLDVSRQSISKWESDAVVPEMDKLIWISEKFNVSISWLLGIEEETEISEEDNKITDSLIKINKSYDNRVKREFNENKKSLKTLTAVIIILCILSLPLYLYSFLQYEELNEDRVRMERSIADTIERNGYISEDLEERYAELYAENHHKNGVYSHEIDFIDYEKQLVSMRFDVIAKRFTKDTTAKIEVINLETNEVLSTDLNKYKDNAFECMVEVPFWNNVQIRVIFVENNHSEYEVIFNDYKFYEIYTPKLEYEHSSLDYLSDTKMQDVSIYVNYLDSSYRNNFQIQNASIYYMCDDELVVKSEYSSNYNYQIDLNGLDENGLRIGIPKIIVPSSDFSRFSMYLKFEDNFGKTYEQYVCSYSPQSKKWYFSMYN